MLSKYLLAESSRPKDLAIIGLLVVFSSSFWIAASFAQVTGEADPRIFSEAPVFFDENGVRQSNALTVKFNGRAIDIAAGVSVASPEAINSSFPSVISFFEEIQRKYGTVILRKQTPTAVWADTLRVNRRTGAIVSIHDMSQLFTIQFNRFVPIDSIIAGLESLKEVAYAHQPIQAIFHADPNDPKFQSGEQWNLSKVNAESAWDITKGATNIVVGIIDHQGVKRTHEDFTNADLTSQFIAGKGDNTFTGPQPHGTKVAGVVAAATDNNKGVASLGWNLKMIPYKWDEGGDQDPGNLPTKIQQAIDDNVDIINMSFGTVEKRGTECGTPDKLCNLWFSKSYSSVQQMIQNAAAQGIVLVASAGNGPLNRTGQTPECLACDVFPYTEYPASYPEVIAVSATEQDDTFRNGWNTGLEEFPFIDVCAPGVGIWTTSGDGYGTDDGTSFSAPLVAALSGLILSINSGLTRDQVKDIITTTAVDIEAPGYDDSTGYGRINAYQALLLTLAYSNKSINQTATARNNGRRLARDASDRNHLVFASGGEIFYRRSFSPPNDNDWEAPIRLSTGNGSNDFPCITLHNTSDPYVVWQRKTGATTYEIWFAMSRNDGTTWTTTDKYILVTTVQSSSDPLPVITTPAMNNEEMNQQTKNKTLMSFVLSELKLSTGHHRFS
jgi:hypothetical protein